MLISIIDHLGLLLHFEAGVGAELDGTRSDKSLPVGLRAERVRRTDPAKKPGRRRSQPRHGRRRWVTASGASGRRTARKPGPVYRRRRALHLSAMPADTPGWHSLGCMMQ